MNLIVSVVEISEYLCWGGRGNALSMVDPFLTYYCLQLFLFVWGYWLSRNRIKCIKWTLSFPTCPCQAAPSFTSQPKLDQGKLNSLWWSSSGGRVGFKEVLELSRRINSVQIWVWIWGWSLDATILLLDYYVCWVWFGPEVTQTAMVWRVVLSQSVRIGSGWALYMATMGLEHSVYGNDGGLCGSKPPRLWKNLISGR